MEIVDFFVFAVSGIAPAKGKAPRRGAFLYAEVSYAEGKASDWVGGAGIRMPVFLCRAFAEGLRGTPTSQAQPRDGLFVTQ